MRFLFRLFAWRCRRLADQIEREYPGPYYPGTYGAEWRSMAVKLRSLATEITT